MVKYNADRVIQIESGDTDFGFEIVDNTPQFSEIADLHQRLDEMHRLVRPLLVNLMKNPERETIKWPNRASKIKPMLDQLDKLRG